MFGEQQQQGYRTNSGAGSRGGAADPSGGGSAASATNAGAAAAKAAPAIPQRRSGAAKPNGNGNSSSSNNGNSTSATFTAAPLASSSGAAAGSSSPAAPPPPMPLAAPRSQQLLASPRSPADFQSSPTVNSPQGSPGTRGYYGSAFASPNSPNGTASGSYSKGSGGPDSVQASGLERLVLEEGLVRTNVPLKELRTVPGTNAVKVGYDGTTVLRAITEAVQEHDPMALFTVTTPVVLFNQQAELVKEVATIAEAVSSSPPQPATASPRTFTPIFVFDGIPMSPLLDFPRRAFPSPPTEVTPFHGQTVNHSVKALPFNMKKLVADRFRVDDDVEGFFIRTLRASFPEVFRAPYNAWAQLSAFFSPTNRYISEVYGCLELLAFPGIDRVIVKFNPDNMTFDYVEKQAVLAAVNRRLISAQLTERDLSYLILTDTQQKLYRLPFLYDANTSFDNVLVKFGGSDPLPGGRGRGYNFARVFYRDRKQELNTNYALLDAPVFTHEATVLPLYTVYGTAPHSCLRARETFGHPLSSVLYFGLFGGLVMPNQLAEIAHGLLVDRWPLIDSAEYRKLLELIVPIRLRTSLHLLAVTQYAELPARWYRGYMAPKALAKDKIVGVLIPKEVPLFDWNLSGNQVLAQQEGQYFLNTLPFYVCSLLPPLDGSVPVYYHTVAETTASVLLKTIDQLGYFMHAVEEDEQGVPIGHNTDLSLCASAMEFFACETLSEYGLLCLELLRTQALHDNPIHLTPSTSPQYQKDLRPGVRFASRLLSLIPINISGTWTGPFDPEIAAFGGITRCLSRTIRLLMESITLSTFCSRRTSLPMPEMYEVLERLPFGLPAEFGAGHLMNYILHNEECTLEELASVFPECSALYEDLGTLFWFWSMAIPAIRLLAEEMPTIDVDMILAANEAVINAAVRLDAANFGYVAACRKEVEAMIQYRVAYNSSLEMNRGAYPTPDG